MKLSRPQRELLQELADRGPLVLRGNFLRTARSLEKRGLAEPPRYGPYGMRNYGITDAGRKALRS